MWEIAGLIVAVAGVLFWMDSLRARERAVSAGRRACERNGLQFLDETVSFTELRLARNDEGRLMLRRRYGFEFSDTGNNRRSGAVVMLGSDIEDLQFEPYPIQ